MQITATALTPPTTHTHTHTHTSLHPGSGEYVCRLSAHFTYQMERTQRRREGVSVLLLRVPQRKNMNVGRQRRACRPAKNERCVCVCVCVWWPRLPRAGLSNSGRVHHNNQRPGGDSRDCTHATNTFVVALPW